MLWDNGAAWDVDVNWSFDDEQPETIEPELLTWDNSQKWDGDNQWQ